MGPGVPKQASCSDFAKCHVEAQEKRFLLRHCLGDIIIIQISKTITSVSVFSCVSKPSS